jgi:hypothetical protein
MDFEQRGIRVWIYFLAAGVLLCSAAAVHSDLDGQYRPTCPACQLERNIGCISLTDASLTGLPEPTTCFTIVELRASKPLDQEWLRIPSTRSPPAGFSSLL